MKRRMFIAATLLAALPAHAEEMQMDLEPDWGYVADTVMGGVSEGRATRESVAGRDAVRLTGEVSTENNGGFIQMATPVPRDVSGWTGIELDVIGNGETYEMRLRTEGMTRPWQSFRAEFAAPPDWTTIRLPFDAFEANRTDIVWDPAGLRRIGVLAVGREFTVDIAVAGMRLYR
ncbi:CIA30 family protein [Jannaschia sp. KMU-145]|uniref:CIA30 family protein n=1 Tax=Jannaschia halovivens TaxID=3388667 RepID=UPI00396B1BD5